MFWNFCSRLPVNPFPDDENHNSFRTVAELCRCRFAFCTAVTRANDTAKQVARIVAQIQQPTSQATGLRCKRATMI